MKLWRWAMLPDSGSCCQQMEPEIPWILLLPANLTKQTPQCMCLGFTENCILFLCILKCSRGTYPGTWSGQTWLFDVSQRVCFNPLPKEESSTLFGTPSALALAVFRDTSGLSDFQVVWVVGQALIQGWNSKTGLDTLLEINMPCSVERLFIQCTMTSYHVATSQWCVRFMSCSCTRTQESLVLNQKNFLYLSLICHLSSQILHLHLKIWDGKFGNFLLCWSVLLNVKTNPSPTTVSEAGVTWNTAVIKLLLTHRHFLKLSSACFPLFINMFEQVKCFFLFS